MNNSQNQWTAIGCGGLLALLILIALANMFGLYIGLGLGALAIYFRVGNLWNPERRGIFLALVALAVAFPLAQYALHSSDREAEAERADQQSKIGNEEKAFKASLPAGTCDRLRLEPRSRMMMADMCRRMYPADSWADSAGRTMCEADEDKTMRACGLKYLPSF